MKNTKRTVCLLMAFCLLFGLMSGGVLAVEEVSFSDVAKDAWYYAPITKAVEKGIVVGNADGTYAPRGTLTWAQTITFAVRLDQLRKGEDVYGSEDQTGTWYDIYVDYALEKGIINSKPVTPGGTITRADAAIIFSKVLGEYTPVNEVADGYFTDVRAAHPAHDAIYMLAEAGIWQPSAEAAAAKVREVWDNPARWWQDERVQSARRAFCREHAFVDPKGPDAHIVSLLQRL